MFYKFIWNGGNDRVKRAWIRNIYNDYGLHMIDPYHFSQAQKMTSVKLLLDNKLESFWKLLNYQRWVADAVLCYGNHNAPESLLNGLHSSL